MLQCPDLLSHLPVGILALDAEGRVRAFNPAAQDMLGLAEADVIGRTVLPEGWSLLDEQGDPLLPEHYPVARARATGAGVDCVIGIARGSDSETLWYRVHAFPDCSAGLPTGGVILSFIDITPQRRAAACSELDKTRAEALLDLNARAHVLDETTLLQEGLHLACALTDSMEGCLHFVEANQLRFVAGSSRCSPQANSEPSLWEEASQTRSPVLHHSQGEQSWHIGIPVEDAGAVVMVLCLGGKNRPFDEHEISLLQMLGRDLWRIIRLRETVHAWEEDRRQLKLVLNASHIGIWEFMVESGVSRFHRECMTSLGEEARNGEDGLLEQLEKIHRDDREAFLLMLTDYLSGRVSEYRQEFRMMLNDGEMRWILSSGEIVDRHADGRPQRMVGTHLDITERKLAEEKIKLAARVFDTNGEGVMITDAHSKILTVNRAFCALTGYAPEEVCGYKPNILSSGRHSQQFFSDLWQAIQHQGFWQGELWNRHKDGHDFPVWLSISAVSDDGGQITHFVTIFTDITERHAQQEKIEYLAFHDALTGLPNRLLLIDRFNVARALADRQGEMLALLYLDLDRFKIVNDTLGHPVGDLLLVEVSTRLLQLIRESDTVSRLGGDEFVVLLGSLHHPGEAAEIAQAILAMLDAPFEIEGQTIRIGATIGMAICPGDARDLAELLKKGDTALYRAKRDGRHMYRFYTESMNADSLEQLLLEARLREAIACNELEVQYQPYARLDDGQLLGFEALVRWRHPIDGLIPPARFIPIAEESGLILDIGAFVLETACRQMRVWLDAGIPPFTMSVNLSALQISRGTLVDIVSDTLKHSGLPADCLELELTESMLLSDTEHCRETLMHLRRLGVHIAIDDFGTGYSSLAYLRRLEVEKLKIDKVFIDGLQADRDDALVRAIIDMAQALNLETIAEGVETPEQAAKLAAMGCNAIQGWYIAAATPAENCGPWLIAHQQGRPLLNLPILRPGPNPHTSS